MSTEEVVNIDSIPDEILILAAKAASLCLAKSGITGIYNEPDVLKEHMKIIQKFEQHNGCRSQQFYSSKEVRRPFKDN